MRYCSSLLLTRTNSATGNYDFGLQLRDNKSWIRFPGAFSIFGGGSEEGEKPEETICREIKEELDLDISKKGVSHYNTFNWRDIQKYINFIRDRIPKADELFGHSLETILREAGKLHEDLFTLNLAEEEGDSLKVREGRQICFFPPDIAKALIMVPLDKIMLLHYIAQNNLVRYEHKR